jgi:signal transduction histidine kinase
MDNTVVVQDRVMMKRQTFLRISSLVAPLVVMLLGLYLSSLYSFLLFHSLAETFSIVVACGIFIFTWNARRYLENNYLLFVGIAFLFIAFLDLFHTLSYEGMSIFSNGANLPTQLWIAARYLQAFTFLIAPFLLTKRLNVHWVFSAYALVTALLMLSIFYWKFFPTCYIEGFGLTPFKIISEYVISVLLVISLLLLWQRRQAFDIGVARLLIASLAVTAVSEIAFTAYVNVYSHTNLVGHLLKFVAFYLVYKAVIETGLEKPFDILLRQLKHNEDILFQNTVELRARNEELDAFAHTVAHDLKDPIATLIITAEVLKDPDLKPDEWRQSAQHLQDLANRMSSIVNELLQLSEVRQADVPLETLDMQAIVNAAILRLQELVQEKQAEIQLTDTWPAALGHAPWVEEVWVNYLSNALKYGGAPPKVSIGAEVQADGVRRFWVRDNGPGLTSEEQELLFRPFTRLIQSRSRGHGLGLSIVYRIVKKLGGQVGVESMPGEGATFYFTLPAAPKEGEPGSSPDDTVEGWQDRRTPLEI